MATYTEYHFVGSDFSGRGVRLRELSTPEVRKLSEIAAAEASQRKDVDPDERRALMRAAELEAAIQYQLVAFTAKPVDEAQLEDPATEWVKSNPADIACGDIDLGAYFGPKDIALMIGIYTSKHEVVKSEMDAIVGKARRVSAD